MNTKANEDRELLSEKSGGAFGFWIFGFLAHIFFRSFVTKKQQLDVVLDPR